MSQTPSEAAAPETRPPAVWNLPYPRNENFTGRAGALADIYTKFSAKAAAERVQVVIGPGGIGKTQLAVEYAYKHRWDYDLIWWLVAEDVAGLTLGYAQLGQQLGLKFTEENSSDDIRHVVRQVLNQRSRWLLILDGAITPQQVAPFLPPRPIAGNVIITSRNPNWSDVGGIVPLGALKRGESIALLRKRTKRNDTNESASKLSQALGDLPIALNQAAAVIDKSHISFTAYLARFEQLWAELLQKGIRLDQQPDAVAMTWELSIRHLESTSPAGMDLLNLCAFLASQPIKRTFLIGCEQRVPPQLRETVRDGSLCHAAVGTLRAYSMMEGDEHQIAVHPMVAAAARHRLDRDAARRWIDAAVRCVAGSFSFQSDDITTWSGTGELLPHALAASEFGENEDVALLEVAELLDHAGRYLYRVGQLVQAKDLLDRAMRIHERVSGMNHPKVAAVANDLGRVLTRLGEHAAAQACFRRALAIDHANYGINDPHTATIVNNFGMALHACGDRAGAREQFEVALKVYETHYGADHPKTASVLNNLGYVVHELGELEQAHAYFERALEITETSYGAGHPRVASILGNVGNIRRALQQYDRARHDLERALRIDENAYGPNHPDVARDNHLLGLLFESMGQAAEARRYFERALAVDESVYGPNHPMLVGRLNALARVHKVLGEPAQSAQYYTRAAAILSDAKKRA